MPPINSYPDLEPRAAALVRHHASRLAAADPRLEQEDMEQELALHLYLRADHFDAGRASRATYEERVVRHRAADLARSARAAKRRSSATLSLEDLHADGDGVEIDREGGDASARTHGSGADWEDNAALRCDLDRFLAMQAPRLRECCFLLLTHSVAETARVLGRHRCSIYAWLATLRERGRAAGLAIYLRTPTDPTPAE